jgi:hypothetical protein
VRKAINDNPIAQVAVLGVLALVAGFLLLTRMSHKSSESSTDTSTSAASVAPGTATAPVAPTDASTAAPSSTTAPSTSAPSSTASSTDAVAEAAAAGEFVAGPGLPASVVRAYADNKVIVLLVMRRKGIDDEAVQASVEQQGSAADVALFMTHAGHVSRYSRIAAGVDLNRVPALIVLRPRKLTQGTPVATVSYGFRGPDSVAQAIHDALYKGPTNLPYYPK